MEGQPMPRSAALVACVLLVGLACAMAWQSLALAADGSYQLVRALGSESVFGSDSRVLGAAVRQGAVVVAARSGITDTQLLSILLGVGQLVVPALIWSLAILMSRSDRLVCAAVALVAGLCAGALSLASVCEIALTLPLTILVAVLLWQPRVWRWRDAVLAVAASSILVASYETALVMSALLAVWATWRATRSRISPERYGCAGVALLSVAAVLMSVISLGAGRNPTHSQSLLYFVVSLEPWPFYVALLGITMVIAAAMLGSSGNPIAQRIGLALGCTALIVAVAGFEPSVTSAFQARGGVAVAGFLLLVFLLARWIEGRTNVGPSDSNREAGHRSIALVVIPVAFVAAMVATNVGPMNSWSDSLDAFRSEVDNAQGIAVARDVVPNHRQAVLWSWTSSSLSLIVRGRADAGILVDSNPSYVPFPPTLARNELADVYTWRSR